MHRLLLLLMSLSTSLVWGYKLDEASGNALDAVGSLDLTDNGSVGSTTGKISNARVLDGSDDRFNRASNSAFQFGDIDWTISGWFYPTSFSYSIRGTLVAKTDTISSAEYEIYVTTGAKVVVQFNGTVTSSNSATLNAWNFFVARYDSVNNTLNIYLNGTHTQATGMSFSPTDSTDFWIGGETSSGSPYLLFIGNIDEVWGWKRLLSDDECDDLYNDFNGLANSDWAKPDTPAAELTTSLSGWWAQDEASGNALDSHTNSLTLTQTGTVGSTTGKVSNCRDYSSGNYFSRTDEALLSFADDDFCWAGWVNFDSLPGNVPVVSKWSGSVWEYILYYHASSARFEWQCNGASIRSNTFGAPSTGTWYFVSVWHDKTVNLLHISINTGKSDVVALSGGTVDGTGTLFFGRNTFGDQLDGKMDEWGLWSRRLYPWERRYLYNSGNGRAYADFAGAPPSKPSFTVNTLRPRIFAPGLAR